jgi:hypothetical protein
LGVNFFFPFLSGWVGGREEGTVVTLRNFGTGQPGCVRG